MSETFTMTGRDRIPAGSFFGGDAVPPGTFHSRTLYRTQDGRADYGFSFEQQRGGQYRAYVTSQPNSSDAHIDRDPAGRRYVCWSQPVWSKSEAQAVASTWADLTQRRVRFGESF